MVKHKHLSYKETNNHDHSHHPKNIQHNIPFNLAKHILLFVTDNQKVAL